MYTKYDLVFGFYSEAPPVFKEELFIRQDAEGDRLMFECRVVSASEPEVIWYQNDLKVKNDAKRKMGMKKDGDSYVLTLEVMDPNRKDAGKYEVKVKNAGGDVKNVAFSYVE